MTSDFLLPTYQDEKLALDKKTRNNLIPNNHEQFVFQQLGNKKFNLTNRLECTEAVKNYGHIWLVDTGLPLPHIHHTLARCTGILSLAG